MGRWNSPDLWLPCEVFSLRKEGMTEAQEEEILERYNRLIIWDSCTIKGRIAGWQGFFLQQRGSITSEKGMDSLHPNKKEIQIFFRAEQTTYILGGEDRTEEQRFWKRTRERSRRFWFS